jgi:hypothetical protein
MKTYVLAVTAVLISSPAWAQTWHVATTGSDDNDCTQAQDPATPKLTINAGIDCAGPFGAGEAAGKTVEVAAGTYDESLWRFFDWPKGSSGNPFTLEANGTVTVRAGSGNQLVYFHDTDLGVEFHIVVTGPFVFSGLNLGTESGVINVFASDIEFNGITITDIEGTGLFGNGKRTKLVNSFILGSADSTFGGVGIGGGGGQYSYPVYYNGSGSIFDGNVIEDFPTFGLHLYATTNTVHDIIVRNNVIRSFGWGKDCGTPQEDPRCNGRGADERGVGVIYSGTGHQTYDNIIYNGTAGISLYTHGNKAAYNNTVFNMSRGSIFSDDPNGNVVENNIAFNPGEPPQWGYIFTWYESDSTAYSSNLCPSSGAACTITGDPLFTSAQ